MADEVNTLVQQAPQDIQAEQATLGSVLISTDPADTLAEINAIVEPDDFFQTRHRLIYRAMLTLDENLRPIDVLTLIEQLNIMNQLENAGGEAYLAELAVAVPIARNAPVYADIVKQKALRRRLIDLLANGTEESYTDMKSVEDLISELSSGLDAIETGANDADFERIGDVVTDAFDRIELNAKADGTVVGLASGYPALDNMTTGFGGGQVIIIAARPGLGKTAFALNILKNVAVENPTLPVAYFSLEMSAVDLVDRMLAAEGNVHSKHIRTGQLTDEEWTSLTVAMSSLGNTKIYMDASSNIRVSEIRSKLRRLVKREGKLGLVIIDYLQLIEGTGNESRQQQVSAISRAIKNMAMELDVPIIALSQLSRGVESRDDKRPRMSDLRESGSIEQDADIVAFLYRDDYYQRDNDNTDSLQDPRHEEADVGDMEVILEKNRRGERGTAHVLFVKSYNKFSSVDYTHDDSNPFG
ncbi:replicative DNA helicase [Weissella soli]|uniref:replicative DNA helicase n=1 Tax=Weissella soli TaxID=155866 RepID=UPI001F439623|nr:replicative DNA helicase [Weissella soli]GJM48686.1 replicative DNA helicase [Weissella soli]